MLYMYEPKDQKEKEEMKKKDSSGVKKVYLAGSLSVNTVNKGLLPPKQEYDWIHLSQLLLSSQYTVQNNL